MELSVIAGIVGSGILLIGAAWPIEKTNVPTKSVKNWLFAIGSLIMMLYAVLGYLVGGSVFFVVLELFVLLAAVLMMLGTKDTLNTRVILIAGILLGIRSVMVFVGPAMILFVIAFIMLCLGYAYKMNTVRRFVFLAIGGALIALSSYLDASWIFFRLNIFFSLFSLIYAIKLFLEPTNIAVIIPQIAAKKPIIKKTVPAKKTATKKVIKKVIKKKPVAKKK